MKFNERWLREWVDPRVDAAELAEQLTRAGLEVDAVEPAASPDGFSGVVVGEVLESGPHPNADRLKLCVVSDGSGEPVEVVCGAPNARAGMRGALARPGARIAGGVKVRRAKIRGIASRGNAPFQSRARHRRKTTTASSISMSRRRPERRSPPCSASMTPCSR